MPYYSFVLVCYNNWSMTKQAIDSLLASLVHEYTDLGVELIIVNNGSQDKTFEELQNFKLSYKGSIEIVIINIQENMGYIVGLNTGLAEAKGKIITVLNNDLIFPPNWFKGLVKALDTDNSLGVVVPYLSYASGVQHLGAKLDSFTEILDFFDKFTSEHKGSIIYTNRVISACLTMRRDVLDLIGGYDAWFGLGQYDDDDWSMRVVVAGYKIGVIGDSFVHHIGTVTFSQNPQSNSASFIANGKKFMKKWNLKGAEHPEGLYTNRDESISHTPYNRKKLYFPIKFEDYTAPGDFAVSDKSPKRYLFIADWTNYKSEWEIKLEHCLRNCTSEKLFIYIREEYFEYNEVVNRIESVLQHFENKENLRNSIINIIYKGMYPDEILEFIKSFDGVISIENDYVNRFILSFAKYANIQII